MAAGEFWSNLMDFWIGVAGLVYAASLLAIPLLMVLVAPFYAAEIAYRARSRRSRLSSRHEFTVLVAAAASMAFDVAAYSPTNWVIDLFELMLVAGIVTATYNLITDLRSRRDARHV